MSTSSIPLCCPGEPCALYYFLVPLEGGSVPVSHVVRVGNSERCTVTSTIGRAWTPVHLCYKYKMGFNCKAFHAARLALSWNGCRYLMSSLNSLWGLKLWSVTFASHLWHIHSALMTDLCAAFTHLPFKWLWTVSFQTCLSFLRCSALPYRGEVCLPQW